MNPQFFFSTILLLVLLSGCAPPQATVGLIGIDISTRDGTQEISIQSGSTVQQALNNAGLELGTLDRVDPPSYTVLTEGAQISIVRISEHFEIEEIVIPFDRQTIRNEALPQGETRLLQPGENGILELTYRVVEEEGIEVSRSPFKQVVIKESLSEILMIGTQAAHTPLSITGRLVYLSAGNVWLIEGNTGNRQPIIVTGDLDGRILKISPDGEWLLFTRQMEDDEENINSLWIASLDDPETEIIDLKGRNVVHFADWQPGEPSSSVVYSTVEPRPSPPGWQANNDLIRVSFTETGRVRQSDTILEPNAGGQYGWWGTQFAWGDSSSELAYARADSIGTFDLERETIQPIRDIVPFQTLSDWAWVPGVTWGHDNQSIFYVDHGEPIGVEGPGASPVFNLMGLTYPDGIAVELAPRSGMFALPSVSPLIEVPSVEIAYELAYLQAISPLESEASSYRLVVMDRDGSNRRELFPPQGEPGLEPSLPIWSPDALSIAVLNRGDLWLVDVETGIGSRLTGDGQTVSYDWNP